MSSIYRRNCIALDIGGTSAKLAIVSDAGAIVSKTSVATPKAECATSVVEAFAGATVQLMEIAREKDLQIEGIGIGHPGFYDAEGRLKDLCNIPALNGFKLGAYFQEAFKMQAFCDTDVSCGTIGEYYYGGNRAVQRFLFLTLGTGIGLGAVLGGRLLRTTRNCLGDPGHIVVDPNGSPCTCGGKGCLEAVASGWAISRQAEEMVLSHRETRLAEIYAQRKTLSPQEVFQAASDGDVVAQVVLSKVAKWIAMGLASFCVILEPEIIALGGGIAAGAREQLLQPVREHLFRIVSPPFARNLQLISARVGPDAGLLGAAALVFYDLSGLQENGQN